MNKRLRRKKRVGEFQELGLRIEWKSRLKEADDLFDSFVDFTESLGLYCFGSYFCSNETNEHEFVDMKFFITRYKGSVTEEEREKYLDFVKNFDIIDLTIGELEDAWY